MRDDPNAMVLPGGKVVVHTGLLEMMSSEDEIAAVLGHETAHVVARHVVQFLTPHLSQGEELKKRKSLFST